jgi:hypothetical protein
MRQSESEMDLSRLKEPFAPTDVEWRIGRAGKNAKGIWATCLAYITNRAIMDRLDDVAGPGNWRNEYKEAPAGGVLCGLSIRIGNEWVTKWDGAGNTEMEAVKGGLSGAMKRAAVQWGIGRYLYDLPEGWAIINTNGPHYGKLPEKAGGDGFHWSPPSLPDWALPKGSGKPPAEIVDRRTGEIQDEPAEEEFINPSQLADLRALMDEVQANAPRFLSYLKVPSLEKLPTRDYRKAVDALERKRTGNGA